MTLTSFDLIDQPWIKVRSTEHGIEELSLRDVLARSHEFRELAGEIPTQDVAILRLLLAVLLGATRPEFPRSTEDAAALFERWWDAGSLPMDVIDPYLERLRDRFDLFHPHQPFYQVAGLTTASGNRTGLSKLVADVPAGHAFFTTRAAAELDSLEVAEAARWLVHCMAFDPSGIKTGAVGDDRVKGGKGYPFGYPAWTGNIGPVWAQGESLFATLVLNTPWWMSGPDDVPLWERAPLGPGVDENHQEPRGPADLFTWPSRRLRLFTTDDRVTDVQISNGDKLGPQNLHPFEAMTAWRHSKAQSKAGQDVLMPVQHEPARRIWQGLGSLLQHSPEMRGGRPAPVVEWLAALEYLAVLPPDCVLDLRICGFEYGTQNSVIVGASDDRLTAAVATLTSPILVQAAVDAASQARSGVTSLANLAGDLDHAAGGDGNARGRTFEIGYALLDRPFRTWVGHLRDESRLDQAKQDWAAMASALLSQAGDALVRDAGPAAIVGRPLAEPGRDKPTLMDAGRAQLRFRSALAKTFPRNQPPIDKEPS